ncbi:hypothetical protein D3C72_891570 [compost metagenome]
MIARGAGAEDAETTVFTVFEQIFGIDGVIGDHAAHRAAAVEQGRRAAYHFNTFDQRRIEEGAVQVAGISPLTHAIHQHQHATAIVPAQVHVLTVGAPCAVERNAWYIAQQVGGRAGGLFIRGGRVDHADHHWRFKGAPGVTRGGDGHLF